MALSGQHRRTADARSRTLRRRFYKGAAIATTTYVVLSIIKFHGQFSYLSYELTVIWAVFLLCYTSFREVLRWNDSDTQSYRGEFWAALIVGGALWMIFWDIVRAWIYHLPSLQFPEDYAAATIETIVLYTISAISAFLYKRRSAARHVLRRYEKRGKATVKDLKRPAAPPGNQSADMELIRKPEVEAALTKASKLDEEHKSQS